MTGLGWKLKAGGYRTAWVGKQDTGMATPHHTPEGRGFDESLIYFEHKNDFYTEQLMQSECSKYGTFVDLWDTGKPARTLNGTGYEEFLFRDRLLGIIDRHDFSQDLFLLYTPHVAHCPLVSRGLALLRGAAGPGHAAVPILARRLVRRHHCCRLCLRCPPVVAASAQGLPGAFRLHDRRRVAVCQVHALHLPGVDAGGLQVPSAVPRDGECARRQPAQHHGPAEEQGRMERHADGAVQRQR